VCNTCGAGKYASGARATSCANHLTSCSAGRGLTPGTTTANGVCTNCIIGSTFSANNNGEGCGTVTVKTCPAGKGLTAATASANGVCNACSAGSTFSANNNGEGCGSVTVTTCPAGKGLTASHNIREWRVLPAGDLRGLERRRLGHCRGQRL